MYSTVTMMLMSTAARMIKNVVSTQSFTRLQHLLLVEWSEVTLQVLSVEWSDMVLTAAVMLSLVSNDCGGICRPMKNECAVLW